MKKTMTILVLLLVCGCVSPVSEKEEVKKDPIYVLTFVDARECSSKILTAIDSIVIDTLNGIEIKGVDTLGVNALLEWHGETGGNSCTSYIPVERSSLVGGMLILETIMWYPDRDTTVDTVAVYDYIRL